MIDVEKIPFDILKDIAHRLEDNPLEGKTIKSHVLERISEMSPTDAFTQFLQWHGIMGYSYDIIRALDSLRAAEK